MSLQFSTRLVGYPWYSDLIWYIEYRENTSQLFSRIKLLIREKQVTGIESFRSRKDFSKRYRVRLSEWLYTEWEGSYKINKWNIKRIIWVSKMLLVQHTIYLSYDLGFDKWNNWAARSPQQIMIFPKNRTKIL